MPDIWFGLKKLWLSLEVLADLKICIKGSFGLDLTPELSDMRLLAPPLVTLGAWPRTHNINLQRAIIRRETCHLCVASSSTRPHALWRQSEPLIGQIGGNKAFSLANRGHTITDNQYNVTTGPTKSSVLLTSRSPPIVNSYQPGKRERKETRISGGLCCIW